MERNVLLAALAAGVVILSCLALVPAIGAEAEASDALYDDAGADVAADDTDEKKDVGQKADEIDWVPIALGIAAAIALFGFVLMRHYAFIGAAVVLAVLAVVSWHFGWSI